MWIHGRARWTLDSAAMCLDDCLDQAEAETEAALGPADVAAEQSVPDARHFVGRNANAGVTDAEQTVRRSPSDARSTSRVRRPACI